MSSTLKPHRLFLAHFLVPSLGLFFHSPPSLGLIQFFIHTISGGMLPKLLGFPQYNEEEKMNVELFDILL